MQGRRPTCYCLEGRAEECFSTGEWERVQDQVQAQVQGWRSKRGCLQQSKAGQLQRCGRVCGCAGARLAGCTYVSGRAARDAVRCTLRAHNGGLGAYKDGCVRRGARGSVSQSVSRSVR